MRKSQKIYLAGPDVFLKDAEDQFIRKKAICEKYGHQGFSPLDNDLILDGLTKHAAAQEIFQNNEQKQFLFIRLPSTVKTLIIRGKVKRFQIHEVNVSTNSNNSPPLF